MTKTCFLDFILVLFRSKLSGVTEFAEGVDEPSDKPVILALKRKWARWAQYADNQSVILALLFLSFLKIDLDSTDGTVGFVQDLFCKEKRISRTKRNISGVDERTFWRGF